MGEMQTDSEIAPPAALPQAVMGPATVDTEDGQWQRLHANYVTVERIASAIFWAVLALVALGSVGALIALVFYLETWFSLVLGCGTLVVLALLGWLFWYLPQRNYETIGWREAASGFEIKRGIWWKHHIFVPRQRIQHTDVVRGPLARKYGLATLVIHTAGTHNHQITLEGLEYRQAEKLRQSLLPQDDRGT